MKNIIILVSVFFISCTKDYKSGTKSYLINNTNYQIVIVPYFKNIVDSTMLQSLKPFEKKQVFESSVMGKTLSPDFGTLLQPYDSVLIIFDEKYRSKHLKFNSDSSCEKCIGFTNSRNISNTVNYTKTITAESKKSLTGYFTYTFIENDFVEAKK